MPSKSRRSFVAVALLVPFLGLQGVHTDLLGDDWPQWLGERRDGIWRESGIIDRFPEGGPPVRWRTPIGAGYSGPAVVGDRVYITDWIKGEKNAGQERVLCLNEKNGKIVWKEEYDCDYNNMSYPAGPRTTPVVGDGKVWTLGAVSHLICFRAEDGKRLWEHELKRVYNAKMPIWGWAATPLLDGQKLIVLAGGEGSIAVAFDKDSGKELWRALTAAEPGYCPPMIYEAGGKRQLIVWHPESINSLDPETGIVYWTRPWKIKAGLTIPTPRKQGNHLFFTAFYNGPRMFELDGSRPDAKLLWKGNSNNEKRKTDKLHSIISTPFLDGDHIYGICSYGQLRCLNVKTGERVWESLKATDSDKRPFENNRWANAFLIKHEDRYFIANEAGDLIIAKLTPNGYEELGRAHLLEPTNAAGGRRVVWSHPAFANRCVYMRNDREIICVSLKK